jgi:hypothetical protein
MKKQINNNNINRINNNTKYNNNKIKMNKIIYKTQLELEILNFNFLKA